MKQVLVTGANGLLATNVIIELLSSGYAVKGLLRDLGRFHYSTPQPLELIQGSFTDAGVLEKALKNCDYVVHAAAITEQNLLGYSMYEKINVEATELLLLQAIKAKVKRFVYVSSVNVFGIGTILKPGNESSKMTKPFTKSHYARSKLAGQQLVLSNKNKIEVVVVNPTFMLGPYDSKPSSGRIILMGYGRKIIFCPPGGKNFVHVQDVAAGLVKALEKGKNGEAYLLANENLSYVSFFQKLSKLTPNRPILIKLPKVLWLAAGLAGNLIRFAGIKTALSLTNMKILCVNGFYDNHKAVSALDVHFQPTEKAIEDAIAWFGEKKMLNS